MGKNRIGWCIEHAGVYLVLAKLCKNRFIATAFHGSVPEYDIIAINVRNVSIPIQVKTINGEHDEWQLNASDFLDIDQKTGKCKPKRTKLSNFIWVFVRLGSNGGEKPERSGCDEVYILKYNTFQYIAIKKYMNAHAENDRIMRKSKHATISLKEISKFQNNWESIPGWAKNIGT